MVYTQKHLSVFNRAESLADADDQCSRRRSPKRHVDVQLPKSFYSDSVISVFSYTARFSLFLFALIE